MITPRKSLGNEKKSLESVRGSLLKESAHEFTNHSFYNEKKEGGAASEEARKWN